MRPAAALVTIAILLGMSGPSAASGKTPRTGPSQMQLVIWNRSDQPIELEVLVETASVFADRVAAGNVATSIEAARIVQREAGTYTVRVIDRTREREESIPVQIAPDGQNLGIHLVREGLAFIVTRADITSWTPAAAPQSAD